MDSSSITLFTTSSVSEESSEYLNAESLLTVQGTRSYSSYSARSNSRTPYLQLEALEIRNLIMAWLRKNLKNYLIQFAKTLKDIQRIESVNDFGFTDTSDSKSNDNFSILVKDINVNENDDESEYEINQEIYDDDIFEGLKMLQKYEMKDNKNTRRLSEMNQQTESSINTRRASILPRRQSLMPSMSTEPAGGRRSSLFPSINELKNKGGNNKTVVEKV